MGREEVLESTKFVPAYMCWATYIFCVGSMVIPFVAEFSEDDYWNGFAAHIISTFVIFLFSFFNSNTSLYDPAWCILPIALGGYWMLYSPNPPSFRGWYAWALLWIWYMRYNWSWPWTGWYKGIETEDWRYAEQAKYTGSGTPLYWLFSLINLHMVPTLLVFFALAPVQKVWTKGKSDSESMNVYDYIGILVCVSAITIQLVADTQMANFRRKQYGENVNLDTASRVDDYFESSKKLFRGGLWGWSRHPNYFGEASFWLGMAFIAFADSGAQVSDFASFSASWMGAIIMFIFFRISARLMDVRNLQHREGYDVVMREISGLVPLPPFLGKLINCNCRKQSEASESLLS